MRTKSIDKATTGSRIRELRLQKGWSQEELGFRVGVNSKSVISLYESDERSATVPVLQALAKELDTSIDYLVNGYCYDKSDPYIVQAIQLLESLKTEEGKKAAVEYLKLLQKTEQGSL